MAPSPLPALNLLRGTVSHSFSLGDAAHNRVAAGCEAPGRCYAYAFFCDRRASLRCRRRLFALRVRGICGLYPRQSIAARAGPSREPPIPHALAYSRRRQSLGKRRGCIARAQLSANKRSYSPRGTAATCTEPLSFHGSLIERAAETTPEYWALQPHAYWLDSFPNSAASNNKRRLRAPEQGFFSGDLEFGRAAPVPSARIRYRDPRRTLKALACRLPRGLRAPAGGQAFLVSAAPVMPSVAGDGSGRLK